MTELWIVFKGEWWQDKLVELDLDVPATVAYDNAPHFTIVKCILPTFTDADALKLLYAKDENRISDYTANGL